MAIRIPKYEQGGNIQTQPLDPGLGREPTPVTGGVAIGEALGQGAKLGYDIMKHEKEKADAFRAAALEANFGKEVNNLLYDSTNGFMLQKGENALDTTAVHARMEELQQKYAAQAVNEDQLRAYSMRVQDRRNAYQKIVEEHAGNQRLEMYKSETNTVLKQALDEATLNSSRPDLAEAAVERAVPTLINHLKFNVGLSAQAINSEVVAFRREGLEKVLEGFKTRGDGVKGLAYLDGQTTDGRKVKDALGVKYDAWYEKLDHVRAAQQGQITAMEVYNLSIDPKTGRPDEAGARKILDASYQEYVKTGQGLDLKSYDEATKRLDHKFAQFKSADDFETAGMKDNAIAQWAAGGHSLSAIDASLASDLKAKKLWFQMEQIDANWRREKLHEPPTDQQLAKMNEIFWLGSQSSNAFDDVSDANFFNTYRHELTTTQFEQASRYAAGLRSRPDKQLPGGINPGAMLLQRLAQNGVVPKEDEGELKAHDPRTWGSDQQSNYYFANNRLQEFLASPDAHKEGNPKSPLDQEKIQTFIDDMMVKTYDKNEKRWFFDPRRWFGNAYPTRTKVEAQATGKPMELAINKPEDIDPVEKAQIIEAYTKTHAGRAPTSDEILARYRVVHSKDIKAKPRVPKAGVSPAVTAGAVPDTTSIAGVPKLPTVPVAPPYSPEDHSGD